MARTATLYHLARIENIVAQGERRIQRQEQLLAELDRDGHDTKKAAAMLSTYRRSQSRHVQQRNMLLKVLEQDAARRELPVGAIFRPGH